METIGTHVNNITRDVPIARNVSSILSPVLADVSKNIRSASSA